VVVVTPYDLSAPTAFARRYRDKYQREPTVAAALAYDALTLWAQVGRRANGFDPAAVRTELLNRETPFESLSGPLTFADDHTARRKVFVTRKEDGRRTTEAHDPEPVK
jgi:ABC-type branched-subunit amino acid transport system substrate-binding protein